MEEFTPERILSAVDRSGYLLEQQVATDLEELGFVVYPNWAFEDPDEGKSREVDVRAVMKYYCDANISVFVELLCECKKTTNPYVFLSRPKGLADRRYAPAEYVFPIDNYFWEQKQDGQRVFQQLHPLMYLDLAMSHYYYGAERKVSQMCKLIRRGKEVEAVHDDVFGGLLYPLAKALDGRKKELSRPYSGTPVAWLFFPAVITTAPLYVVESDADSPTATAIASATLQRSIRSKSVNGVYVLDFVAKASLISHVKTNILAFAQAVAERFRDHPTACTASTVTSNRIGDSAEV